MWSRIHVELGLSPTPLTLDMLTQAVSQRVRENEDLDWKLDLAWKNKDLPAEVKAKKKAEFAKDVAAMANTRGGLIVFGVRDENEEAADLTGLSNDERTRQSLRVLIWHHVRPLVDGVLIEAINGEDGEPGLIAVFVPPSPDAPHLVGDKNEVGVPYRYGTDTNWMSEGQLERAYRDRFSRRADDRAALSTLMDGLVPEIDLEKGIWVAVAARPVAPLPLLSGRPERDQATATMKNALQLASEMFGQPQGRVPMLDMIASDAVNNPRNGLRRWVIRSNHYPADPHELVDWALVELHHDGSVALAIGMVRALTGVELPGDDAAVWHVWVAIVDAVITEAVALVSAHVRGLGGVGTILTRAALLRDETSGRAPLVAIDNRASGGMQSSFFSRVPGSRALREPVAVETEFSADAEVATLRGVARQLADDLDQQFGMRCSSIPE
ncbi:putative DNA-binding protein [Amycolatopsis sulphurea]|uniref:Putative DNA-binding protein n=2 Tax=Amycolatopsis sulphurea TaxID=76022 RepID=A0A2A9FH15_9PSEU|nr:putative DNA-binding protein [Amycolatopsis sulphurea]